MECFVQAAVKDVETAARYRCSILEVGGSWPMHESFRKFMRRAPELNVLLRQCELMPLKENA
jgi:Zn-dependent oligopeptidase